jgi:cyclin-dependent kinase 7
MKFLLGLFFMKCYVKEKRIGEGTYAVIYKGYECERNEGKETPGREVAIKKIKHTKYKSGMEMSALREIKHLKRIQSEYVIEILDVFEEKGSVHIVLEYMESNLEALIKSKRLVFMPQDVKAWMLMITKGLFECHSRFILHRDLKPNNILVSRGGFLKIADFGISRDFGFPIGCMTNQVITRWYKSPELLFGSKTYSFGVDIWALGCVFAEMLLRTPYLPGNSDVHQLDLIFTALGTPTEVEWPGIKELPCYVHFEPRPRNDPKVLFSGAGSDATDLLEKMLVFNPEKRISCQDILSHKYFTNTPAPTLPSALPFSMP